MLDDPEPNLPINMSKIRQWKKDLIARPKNNDISRTTPRNLFASKKVDDPEFCEDIKCEVKLEDVVAPSGKMVTSDLDDDDSSDDDHEYSHPIVQVCEICHKEFLNSKLYHSHSCSQPGDNTHNNTQKRNVSSSSSEISPAATSEQDKSSTTSKQPLDKSLETDEDEEDDGPIFDIRINKRIFEPINIDDDDDQEGEDNQNKSESSIGIYISKDIFEPVAKKRKPLEPPYLTCQICNASFLSSQGLKSHLYNHDLTSEKQKNDDLAEMEEPTIFPDFESQDYDEQDHEMNIMPALKCEVIMEEKEGHIQFEDLNFENSTPSVSKSTFSTSKENNQNQVAAIKRSTSVNIPTSTSVSITATTTTATTLASSNYNQMNNNIVPSKVQQPLAKPYISCDLCHAAFLSSQGLKSHQLNSCIRQKKEIPLNIETKKEGVKLNREKQHPLVTCPKCGKSLCAIRANEIPSHSCSPTEPQLTRAKGRPRHDSHKSSNNKSKAKTVKVSPKNAIVEPTETRQYMTRQATGSLKAKTVYTEVDDDEDQDDDEEEEEDEEEAEEEEEADEEEEEAEEEEEEDEEEEEEPPVMLKSRRTEKKVRSSRTKK